MALFWILASLEIAAMGLVMFLGLRRGRDAGRGATLVASGIGLQFAYAVLIALPALIFGFRTRLLQEIPNLVATLLILAGLVQWQPGRRGRRIVGGVAVVYVVLWLLAQWEQGIAADFSQLSFPLQASVLVAGAGLTVVARVRMSDGPWTRELWFWFCIGLMLVYGTGAVLDPLMNSMFGFRDDLVRLAYYLRLVGAIGGYGLMIWGAFHSDLVRPGRLVPVAG